MKKRVVILILTLVFLAGAMAAAGLPLESRAAAATSKPTETPAVTPGSLPEPFISRCIIAAPALEPPITPPDAYISLSLVSSMVSVPSSRMKH